MQLAAARLVARNFQLHRGHGCWRRCFASSAAQREAVLQAVGRYVPGVTSVKVESSGGQSFRLTDGSGKLYDVLLNPPGGTGGRLAEASTLLGSAGLSPELLGVSDEALVSCCEGDPVACKPKGKGGAEVFQLGRSIAALHALAPPGSLAKATDPTETEHLTRLVQFTVDGISHKPSKELALRALAALEGLPCPQGGPGQRLVLTHGDAKPASLLTHLDAHGDGAFKFVDLVNVGVRPAVTDLAHIVFTWDIGNLKLRTQPEVDSFRWFSSAQHHAIFAQAYLQASGLPHGAEDVQVLLWEVACQMPRTMLYVACVCHSLVQQSEVSDEVLHYSADLCRTLFLKVPAVQKALKAASES